MRIELGKRIIVTLILAFATTPAPQAQQFKTALPRVVAAEVPLYPIGPHTANVQGDVRVKVRTDGRRVVAANIESDGGNPALARAAEENVWTWRFGIHDPTTFTVTYRYKLVTDIEPVQNNPRVLLRLPTEVEVDELRWPRIVVPPVKLK